MDEYSGLLDDEIFRGGERDGRLRIACVTRALAELFRLTGLRRIFQISDSIEAAIKSLHKGDREKP